MRAGPRCRAVSGGARWRTRFEPVARAVAEAGIGISSRKIGMRRQPPGPARSCARRSEYCPGTPGYGRRWRRPARGPAPADAPRAPARAPCRRTLSSSGCACAVSRTARRRRRRSLSIWSFLLAGGRVSSAPCQSSARHCRSNSASTGQASLGVEPQRALGELAGGLRLALALRFQKQPAQAELLGIGRGEHRFEDAPRRRPVAGELRRLGTQKMRQRFVGKRLSCLAGIARMASALSPAPIAIMPLDNASMPRSCRRVAERCRRPPGWTRRCAASTRRAGHGARSPPTA